MRSIEEMQADLAHCDRDGTPWPAAAKRLLADFPDLLGVVQAVESALDEAVAEQEGFTSQAAGVRYARAKVKQAIALAAATDAPQPADPPSMSAAEAIRSLRRAADAPQPEPASRCACGHDAGLHSASEPHPCTESNDRDWYCPCSALRVPSPAQPVDPPTKEAQR